MVKEPEFSWDPEEGVAICVLEDEKGRISIGQAECHEEDSDMMSEKTGCEIAFRRARMEQIRTIRDCDIKPALAALKQLYYSMKHSSQFNPKSYENRTLQRHIRSLEFDLATIKEEIANERQELKDLITEKDNFYKQIRVIRQKAKNN